MNDVISHASFGEIARFKFLVEMRISARRETRRLGDDESFSVLYVICVKLYLFHITRPLKTSNFFPASLLMGFDPFNQGKFTILLIIDSSSPNLRASLLSDILLSNKNLKRAISPNEACEITSFTGFSGLFYILARIHYYLEKIKDFS